MAFDNKACLDVMKLTHELIKNNKPSIEEVAIDSDTGTAWISTKTNTWTTECYISATNPKNIRIRSNLKCSYCGAPLSLNHIFNDVLVKCEYCDTVNNIEE